MNIYKIRRKFIIAQLIVFLLALGYEYSIAKTNDYTAVLLYSLWNAVSYFWLFIKELKYAPDFHPYQILALITAQFTGLNGVSCYTELSRGNILYFGATAINSAIIYGILYLSLEHIILFGVFYYMEARHKKQTSLSPKIADRIKGSSINYFSWAIYFYIIVWFMRIINLYVPLSSISSILVTITNGGYIVSLFLLTFSMIQHPKYGRAKVFHWIIVAIEIALVMNHGMKEEILRTLVPYCVYILISFKAGYTRLNSRTIVQVVLMATFVIAFVFPYVSVFRSLSKNSGRTWDQISTSEALSEYDKYVNKEGNYANDDEERGTGYLMSRAGSISCNAFSIDYVRTNGTSPQFFIYCCTALIPRIIWHNKPSVVTGGMAYSLATGDSDWLNSQSSDDYGTSVSLGYIGSCYLSLGLFKAILLIIIQSFFIWYIWHFFQYRMLYNIVALWAFSAIILAILKDFESFGDCGLNFMVFNLIYMIICSTIYKGPKRLMTK